MKAILIKIPDEIEIYNSFKKSPFQLFSPFNNAPQDRKNYKNGQYENGCINLTCGLGLSPYGYYCCGNAGGIDRIFGFNMGRKSIPSDTDRMIDQIQAFCKLCGIFSCYRLTKKERMSPSWKKVYASYKINKPQMESF
ncbi:hypothetical protein ACFL2Y_02610 [Candidatus Omnitrophota bacterium]